MKLKFKQQAFQTDAVNSVVDLFAGQEKDLATFSITQDTQMSLIQNDYGIGNALCIDEEALLNNMHEIQKRNNLPMSPELINRNFCIEMETGTGKTYVYTKTIFELNRRYGFTKFIIVVPSVAIREGVYKSFQITNDHFALQYDNVPCRYFIYNSAKLSDVRQFATSAAIEIMIINIDAFKKSENIINQTQDKLNGETAMRYIQDTNPVVIIDEPQSVDNTPKSKEAVASLNPLCVLRYSATHKEKINLLYRLTPVDAYQLGLVKQISVSSNQVFGDFNKPYIKLISVSQENGFKAKIEIDVLGKTGTVARKTITVKPNSDLFVLSGERELYDGYSLAGLDCTPSQEGIEFTNTEILRLGKSIGDIDENIVKRAQIRRTIETHMEKELRYYEKGIKVLSLFFIDEVKKYRTEDGGKGIYAQMFEECYHELLSTPKFANLKDKFPTAVENAHNGYFSQDKKGNYKNTKGDTIDDTNTYNTIMKDKEWLLSFDCPLRFIFSHSALKEGWDAPNVFQVCTLIEQKSTFTCRQKVGRGLRLCVNQEGERIEDKEINVLHVMANESFTEFASTLQKEIEEETGVKFGVLQLDLFSGLAFTQTKKEEKPITEQQASILLQHLASEGYLNKQDKNEIEPALASPMIELPKELETAKTKAVEMIAKTGSINHVALSALTSTVEFSTEISVTYEDAAELMNHFEKKGYISKSGKVKDTMKNDLRNGTLDLPEKFESAREKFENIISRADRTPPIRDASKDVVVRLNKEVMLLDPAFQEIWNNIKQKTTYRVQIDSKLLMERCIKEIKEMPPIPKAKIVTQTADITIQRSGISQIDRGVKTTAIENSYAVLPDVLAIMSEQTLTKRATIFEILKQSGRIQDFVNNPQLFLEAVTKIIQDNRHALAIDGISYRKLAGQEYYMQEIFDSTELIANIEKNAIPVEHSVYDHIIYDSSTVERPFALALDHDDEVKMFFKIPSRFKIKTPIGTYNPDWAVYLEQDGTKKLCFILETKGNTSLMNLRTSEQLKIYCGKQHFKALDNGVELHVVQNWDSFKMKNV